MHELSIVTGIVRIAEEQVRKLGASKVACIELEIGELAGIDRYSLDFVWELGVQKSVLEHSAKDINNIPGKAKCLDCHHTFHMKALFDACPECGSYFNEVLEGKELRVKALTVI